MSDFKAFYPYIFVRLGLNYPRLPGLKKLGKHETIVQQKRVAVFAAGLSPADEATLSMLKKNNRLPANAALFCGRGAWDYDRLTAGDRFLCRLLHAMIAKKDPSQYEEPWMQTFMECYKKNCDLTDRAYLAPLAAWLNG